ncbi:MAG: TetR/AcrR family transcriptional regulator [Archangium sp.]
MDSPNRRKAQPKPVRLKERLREATAAAILEAAQEVLVEQGMQAPMEVIAARAGVAVGTLYNHFSDRRQLVDSLLSSHREKLFTDVKEAEAASQHLPVREQLLAMLTPLQSRWARIYLVIKQGEAMPDAKKRAEMRERFTKMFERVLERGRKQGSIAPDPHGVQAFAMQGLVQGLFSVAADSPHVLAPEVAVVQVVDFFLQGAGTGSRKSKP